jgi:peptidoglycan/LPS O-acetylase OafA/YrhL
VHDAWARWNPLRGRGLSPWASFAAYGVVLLIVAVVIERVVGEPARRVLRRRWIDRRRVTATGVAERDASVAARRPGGSIPAVASSRASDSATLVAAESGR